MEDRDVWCNKIQKGNWELNLSNIYLEMKLSFL